MSVRLIPVLLCAMFAASWDAPAAQLTAQRSDKGVVIKIDGQLFTEYWTEVGNKPILWPIIGPTGKAMTRAYPMGKLPNEREDHIHQRSFWFTHGDLNGVSFWDELATYKGRPPKHAVGAIKHKEFVEIASGPQAVVVTRNDWVDPQGAKLCGDVRRLVFTADASSRQIDFEITLTADPGPVTFGDTKEGAFGVRVAETMKVDAKLGGRIVNSEGLVDKDAWGKRSSWVDYIGPVDGEILGLAILNHPTSFRYPTYWHVRTYGLFAANPFGVADFTGSKDDCGRYVLPKGQSLSLRYRVLLHKGDEKQGKVAEVFAAYAKQAN